jgi:hypothetical protein
MRLALRRVGYGEPATGRFPKRPTNGSDTTTAAGLPPGHGTHNPLPDTSAPTPSAPTPAARAAGQAPVQGDVHKGRGPVGVAALGGS